MTYIHDLNPVAFQFFFIKVYWYSLAYVFGFLISISYSKYLIKVSNYSIENRNIDDFFGWAVIGVIVGGRLGYVFFYNINFFIIHPIEIFKIWKGGMSFHGGMIGLIFSMLFFSKNKKKNFFEISSIIAACAPIGICLGRIANFINGELVGKPTNSSWGVIFDPSESILRHPSQLYESFLEGIVLFVIIYIFISQKRFKKYYACFIFLIFYGLFRFSIEFFREPDEQIGYLIFNLSMGQILSIPMVILGLVFLKIVKNEKYNS